MDACLRRDYRRATARAKLRQSATGTNRSYPPSLKEETLEPPFEEVDALSDLLRSKRTHAEVSNPDLFAGANRVILEKCWQSVHTPTRSLVNAAYNTACRMVLLFAYGSTPQLNLHSHLCIHWTKLAIPDRFVIMDPLINKFGKDGKSNGFWPEFYPRSGGIVWDIGAGSYAEGTRDFIYPKNPEHIHMFEVVPEYYENLKENWKGKENVTFYNFGLDRVDKDSSIVLAGSGSSFFHEIQISANWPYLDSVGDKRWGRDRSKSADVRIRSVVQVWHELKIERLSFLYMNCEGCEYVVIPALSEAGLLNRIDSLYLSQHVVVDDDEADLCDRKTGTCDLTVFNFAISRSCGMRELLSQTHTRVFGILMVSERWELLPGSEQPGKL